MFHFFSMLVHQGMLVVLQVVCHRVLPLLATIKPGIVEDPTGSSLFTDTPYVSARKSPASFQTALFLKTLPALVGEETDLMVAVARDGRLFFVTRKSVWRFQNLSPVVYCCCYSAIEAATKNIIGKKRSANAAPSFCSAQLQTRALSLPAAKSLKGSILKSPQQF